MKPFQISVGVGFIASMSPGFAGPGVVVKSDCAAVDVPRRMLWFILAAASWVATLSVMAQVPSAVAASAKLGSTVFHWDALKAHPTGNGLRRDVANGPTATLENLECHISTLNPSMSSHPPHRHPQEEFIIVKEGTLDVFIEGKVQRAGPGSLLFFASHDLHNMTNVGDRPATYYVFQVTTAATHAPANPAATNPLRLRSGVFDWERLAVETTKTGARRRIVDAPTATCVHFECHATTLDPGEIPHAPHHHPDEELVIVKEGAILVTINGATQSAGPGSIAFFASNDEHGLKNVGAAPATYYVVRIVTAATPRPATQ